MRWRLKSPVSQLFTQPFVQTQIKENIFTSLAFVSHRWIPLTKGQSREIVSIWWRHRALSTLNNATQHWMDTILIPYPLTWRGRGSAYGKRLLSLFITRTLSALFYCWSRVYHIRCDKVYLKHVGLYITWPYTNAHAKNNWFHYIGMLYRATWLACLIHTRVNRKLRVLILLQGH